MLFTEMNLPEFIERALEKHNLTTPTEIQEKSIPVIASGKDLVGKSQTGSGKTFAYGIPALDICDSFSKVTQILIVCPTRELAGQVTDELRKLNEFKEGNRVVPIFGGSSIDRQIKALKQNAKIVVGTPGRLMDHLRRKTLKLKFLKMLILDEADEMLDMGFREDLESIIEETNPDRQTIMFSATMPKPIIAIAKNYMNDPEYVEINKTNENLAIAQKFIFTGDKDKEDVLKHIIEIDNPNQAIIFCNTKRMVDKLTVNLQYAGISAKGLHGDMRQGERKRVLSQIKDKSVRFLIATDVAARGLDIKGLDAVYNYDIPENTDYYTHRIGRTGRAGANGIAYTIVNNKYHLSLLREITAETKNEIEEYICQYSKEVPELTGKVSKPKRERKSGGQDRNRRSKRPMERFEDDKLFGFTEHKSNKERPSRNSDRFEREERPSRNSNRFEREERSSRNSDRFEREERPSRNSGRFEREERPSRNSDRFEREERPSRNSGRFEREDNSDRQFNRTEFAFDNDFEDELNRDYSKSKEKNREGFRTDRNKKEFSSRNGFRQGKEKRDFSKGNKDNYSEKKNYRKPFEENKAGKEDDSFVRPASKAKKEDSRFRTDKKFDKWQDKKPYEGKKFYEDKKPYEGKKSYEDKKPYEGKKSYEDKKPYEGKKSYEGKSREKLQDFDGERKRKPKYSARKDKPMKGSVRSKDDSKYAKFNRKKTGK